MRFVTSLALLGVVSVGAMACQAPIEEPTDDAAGAIQGGTADNEHKFAVGIRVAGGGVCSGVLIAPNLVMTAQHCVSGSLGKKAVDCENDTFSTTPTSAPDLTVTTDAKLPGKKTYRVANVVVPESKEICNADIALLVLSSNVPASEAKPATPSLKTLPTSGKITAIGYGRSDTAKEDSGERRSKSGISIQCVPSSGKDCKTGDREFVTAGGVCEGDSGSGSFQISGSNATVNGILARTQRADGACSGGIYTRTDMYGTLIVAAAIEAARKGNYAAPAWARPSGEAESEALPSFGRGSASKGTTPGETEETEEGSGSAVGGILGNILGDELGEAVGGLFDGVDWGEVLQFAEKVLPKILGSDAAPPREDKTPTPPAEPKPTVKPGGDREAPAAGPRPAGDDEGDGDGDQEEEEVAPKKKKASGGCSAAPSGTSGSTAGLLAGVVGLMVARGRRRRASNAQ